MNLSKTTFATAICAIFFILFFFAATTFGQSGVWNVTKTEDTNDGVCDADCSLREAIAAAQPGDIVLAVFNTPRTITLSDEPGFGELITDKSLTIRGGSAAFLTITRPANSNLRVFRITGSNPIQVTLGRMTIAGGNGGTFGGGAIFFGATPDSSLRIFDCHLTNNRASGSVGNVGAAIQSTGRLLIENSTISNNTVSGSGANNAGGILAFGQSFEMFNSTVSGNVVSSPGSDNAGGIVLDSGTAAIITNSTVTDNEASGASSAGGIAGAPNTILRGTIVAGNRNSASVPDVTGNFTSQGYNLIGNVGSSQGFGATGDRTGTSASPIDPRLAALADNGGAAPTHALLPGSPAIDSGNSFGLTVDQRRLPRPVDNPAAPPAPGGDNSDIGAFEAARFAPLVVTKIEDTNDGACDAQDCSLREAIAAAGARGNEIVFASPLFDSPQTITLSDAAGFRALAINQKSLMITGRGANLLNIRRNPASSVNHGIFNVTSSASDRSAVGLSGITISGGRTASFFEGGGVSLVAAELTLTACHVTNNESVSGQNAGGGILAVSNSALFIKNSTVSNNRVSNANAVNSGGGVFIGDVGNTFLLENSTVSGNTVAGGSGNAGGIYSEGVANAINNSTVADNAGGAAGGLYAYGEFTTVRSSIIAKNRSNGTVPDVGTFSAAFVSQGFNFIGSALPGSGFVNNTNNDRVGTLASPSDPRIDALANYGGTTPTHRLLSNSPAIDKGNSFGLMRDQRGATRPVDIPVQSNAADGADIGAFEAQTAATNQPPVANSNSYTAARNTALSVAAPGVLANDTDPDGDSLSAIKVTNPAHGSVTLNANGSFTYTPNAGYIGSDSFTYKASDGAADSNVATVFLTVTAGIVVNKTADTNDGICDADCSLREALSSLPFGGTIDFDLPGAGPHTIQLDAALPALTANLDIVNTSRESITVRGEGAADPYRIFTVGSGRTVQISKLVVSNGYVSNQAGGGIINSGALILNDVTVNSSTAAQGGGIFNSGGTLTLQNSTIDANFASTFGGGLFNASRGTVTLVNSTVSGNIVAGIGGGIYSDSGSVNLTSSTVSGNAAAVDGGGIYSGNAALTITSVTVTANRADSDSNNSGVGGGIVAGNALLRNSIVADNYRGTENTIEDDVIASLDAASSFNLIGTGGAGGLIDSVNNNQVGVADPGLSALADNGGATQTHRLLGNSPAIDKGSNFGLSADQRGALRPVDVATQSNSENGTDVGAFEMQVSPTAASISVTGRVFTPQGSGVPNATVALTDTNGNTRTARTNSFGYFRFTGVTAGTVYIVRVFSKSYRFTPQVIAVSDEITELNFTADGSTAAKNSDELF